MTLEPVEDLETEIALVKAALDVVRARQRLDVELARVRGLALELVPDPSLGDEERTRSALELARGRLVKAVRA